MIGTEKLVLNCWTVNIRTGTGLSATSIDISEVIHDLLRYLYSNLA